MTLDVWYNGDRVKESRLKSIASKDLNTCTALKDIFTYLESNPSEEQTGEDVIEDIISRLQNQRFDGNMKVSFLIEQLTVIFKIPTRRRYSPSLLAMASLWQRISAACYKLILQDNVITLPSSHHLRRLCSSIDINCMELTQSTIAYLTARYNKLNEKDKLVSVLMDEVYTHQDLQYINGNFFGAEKWRIDENIIVCHD